MPTYAVIGASRGIGLEFVVQLAARPDSMVFAVIRSMTTATHLLKAKAAAGLKNVHIVEGDVTDYASMELAAKKIKEISGGGIDWLLHSVAYRCCPECIHDYANMDELDAGFIEAYKINTLGVIHSISAFLPLIRASSATLKKVIVLSSAMADIKVAFQFGDPSFAAYSITKAATNVATTKLAVQLQHENIIVVSVHPGMVDTWETRGESGDPAASENRKKAVAVFKAKGFDVELMTPTESVEVQLKTFDELTMDKTGRFLNFDGKDCAY